MTKCREPTNANNLKLVLVRSINDGHVSFNVAASFGEAKTVVVMIDSSQSSHKNFRFSITWIFSAFVFTYYSNFQFCRGWVWLDC